MNLLNGLNERQLEAVTTTEGPVMVMAGAGSGKTKVLTTRIAYLISKLGIPSTNILAVTFTNKAANEMKQRIEGMLSIETKYMWVSTFHSFCCRLLRLEIKALPPYTSSFQILDEEDSLKVVKDIMKQAELDEFKPKEIRSLISKSKNFTDFRIDDPRLNNIFTIVLEKYEEFMKENNALDFDDLIIKTILLFQKNPSILQKYQNKFQYILVDEFQDTNTLQYNLIFMLSARYHNIFVVGDDFQSIYSFRGAKIENINRFRRDFLETKLILLEENYRSTKEILSLANCIIEHNPNQIKKVMFSKNKEGQMPFYYNADSSYDEVMFVIDKIKELVACGACYSDFAILYRSNYISRNFEDMLVRYQVPYKIYGGLSFFARKEIKDIVAYLRVIVYKDDDISFRRIINEPKRKIGPKMLENLTNIANENNISLFDSIEKYYGKGIAVDALNNFKSVINDIKAQLDNVKLKDLVDIILENTGYEAELKKDEDSYEDRIGNIKELKSVLKEADEFYEGTNLEKLELMLSDLALRTDNENDDVDKVDCVRLSTYHQVKGLEFTNVFMVAMEEGIFPSMNCTLPSEIEEERRICYVGITRAKEKLYLTSASSRFLFGQQAYMKPSRFISEMNKELFKNISKGYHKYDTSTIKKSTLKVMDKPTEKITKTQYEVGDKVNHKAFGDGMVVSVEGDLITVAFKVPYGIKKLNGTHPAIRKL